MYFPKLYFQKYIFWKCFFPKVYLPQVYFCEIHSTFTLSLLTHCCTCTRSIVMLWGLNRAERLPCLWQQTININLRILHATTLESNHRERLQPADVDQFQLVHQLAFFLAGHCDVRFSRFIDNNQHSCGVASLTKWVPPILGGNVLSRLLWCPLFQIYW